jgi:hypothetical protein
MRQKKTDTAVECGRIFRALMKTKWEVKNLPEVVPGVEAGERARQLQDAATFLRTILLVSIH